MDDLVNQNENLERVKSDSKTLNRSFESVGKSNHIVGAFPLEPFLSPPQVSLVTITSSLLTSDR